VTVTLLGIPQPRSIPMLAWLGLLGLALGLVAFGAARARAFGAARARAFGA
jgi:hypothetical protein